MVLVMIGGARRHTIILTYTCFQFEHHKLKLMEAIYVANLMAIKIKETFGCWLLAMIVNSMPTLLRWHEGLRCSLS